MDAIGYGILLLITIFIWSGFEIQTKKDGKIIESKIYKIYKKESK